MNLKKHRIYSSIKLGYLPQRQRRRVKRGRLGLLYFLKRFILGIFKFILVIVSASILYTLGIVAYFYLVNSPYFQVKEIKIKGIQRINKGSIYRAMGRVHGVNIFKLDIDKIEAALLKHPWVKEVNVYRRLSRTIEVVINEWVPKAIVHLGHLYFVDSNGVLFKRVDEEEINLPVITGISSRLYKKSPRRFQQIVFQAFRLIEAFKELDRGVLSEVHYKVGSGWSLYTIDGIALYLGEGNYKEKLKVLNMYFNHFLSLDQELRYVYIQKASPWRFIVGYKNKINIKEEREEP